MRIFWGRIIILLIILIAAICEIIAVAALAAGRDTLAVAMLSGGVVPGVLAAATAALVEGWVRR